MDITALAQASQGKKPTADSRQLTANGQRQGTASLSVGGWGSCELSAVGCQLPEWGSCELSAVSCRLAPEGSS
jgi:hypothetical protein